MTTFYSLPISFYTMFFVQKGHKLTWSADWSACGNTLDMGTTVNLWYGVGKDAEFNKAENHNLIVQLNSAVVY